ncbi:PhoU domain-containing protein [Verrucomicrobium sp. BvORR106]|uniref:phosphate signaling complex PhoU family protein n=1 Tax=Verrucomicrobium sp. BvORR106 TaxID=1403819 RepID=UPI00068B4A8A|nr:PhoU domain-containing protein [Verrucomicrobium sp. BvORR106]
MIDPSQGHISSQFNRDLGTLRDNVLMMSALTERSLANAQAGLFQRDAERCNRAIADDDEIDTLERELSAEAMRVILRFQPVALDLRVVVATIKISVNLERIADHAVSIARRARKLLDWEPIPQMPALAALFTDCCKFHHQVVEAFVTHQALSLNFLEIAHAGLIRRAQEYGDTVAARMPYELDQAINACMELVHIAKLLEQIVGTSRDIGTDTQFAFNPEFVAVRRQGVEGME